MALSIVLVAIGIGAGWALYCRPARADAAAPDPLERAAPGVFAALGKRLGFDELYAATVGRLNDLLAALADALDRWVWDGGVRLLGWLGTLAGKVGRGADEQGLNAGFDAGSDAFRGTGRAYSRAQTGEAHGYLRALAIGFVVLALLALLGGSR
jgi:NADH-quinone oxidoreductase subunit L